jgi:predicted Zn-ribbon and HTH transcriptional regulator
MTIPKKSAIRKMERINVEIASNYINELIPVWLRCHLCGYKWQNNILKTFKCPKCGSIKDK